MSSACSPWTARRCGAPVGFASRRRMGWVCCEALGPSSFPAGTWMKLRPRRCSADCGRRTRWERGWFRSARASSCSPPPGCSMASGPPRIGGMRKGWPRVIHAFRWKRTAYMWMRAAFSLRRVVRRDYGAEVANSVARRLVMPPHRDGGQAQFVAEPLRDRREEGLAPVLAWAQANLARALRVDDLARRAAMSPRTFARQFVRQNGTTPHQWLMHQRVLAAQRRLETTAESIDQVAAAVGLESSATLRVHFARTLGISPAAYRRRFSTATTRQESPGNL